MNTSEVRIKDIALNVFRQRGIRSSTLYDIALACGTQAKAISTLFHSKKELVIAVLERVLDRNSSYLQVNPVLSPSAVAELDNFFGCIEKLLADELRPDLLFEIKKYHPQAWTKLQAYVDQKLIPYLHKNIQRGISEGCYRNDFDHELYAPMYFVVLHNVVDEQTMNLRATKKIINELNKVFLNGILTQKGMRL